MVLAFALRYRRLLGTAGQRFRPALERRYARSVHEGFGQALGVSLAFLVSALILVDDSRLVDEQPPTHRAWQDRALKKVHATAIELPTPAEAKAAERIQILHWERRRLESDFKKVQAQYQSLAHELEERFLDQEAKLEQAYAALRQERDERKALERGLVEVVDRRLALRMDEPFRARAAVTDDRSVEPPESSSGQANLSVLRAATKQIADGLRKTQNQAISSGNEQVFTVDVEDRSFRLGSQDKKHHIDHRIDITFHTAKKEIMGKYIGHIRFFPDGASTGGSIRLGLLGKETQVDVKWTDSSVTAFWLKR